MTTRAPNILFLEKGFLRLPAPPLRGVELFNLHFIDELLKLGHEIVLPAHEAWRGEIEARAWGPSLRVIWSAVGELAGAPGIALRLGRGSVDTLFLANVGNGLIPLLHLLRMRGVARKLVLLANREASPRFVRSLRRWPSSIVCVNEQIARPFRAAGYPRVAVDYGVMNAERFFPGPRAGDGRVRFVVLGALDNAWKGADTAVEAFRQLPAEVSARCELHLASFSNVPAGLPAGVTAHTWMPADQIPAFLREMDVMLCPSRDEGVMRETFSQVFVQGMLTGLPVIASDLAIFVEKLDAGGGFIVRSPAEWTAQMAALARDAALRARLGAEGRETALARYVWDTQRFIQRHVSSFAP